MLNADPSKVSSRAKKRGLPQVRRLCWICSHVTELPIQDACEVLKTLDWTLLFKVRIFVILIFFFFTKTRSK